MARSFRGLALLRLLLLLFVWIPWFIAVIVILGNVSEEPCPCVDRIYNTMWYPTYCRNGWGKTFPCTDNSCIRRNCNEMPQALLFSRLTIMAVHAPSEGDPMNCSFAQEFVKDMRTFTVVAFVIMLVYMWMSSAVVAYNKLPRSTRCVGLLDMVFATLSLWGCPFFFIAGISMGKACGMWGWDQDYCRIGDLTPYEGSMFEKAACAGRGLLISGAVGLLLTTCVMFVTGYLELGVGRRSYPNERAELPTCSDPEVYGQQA